MAWILIPIPVPIINRRVLFTSFRKRNCNVCTGCSVGGFWQQFWWSKPNRLSQHIYVKRNWEVWNILSAKLVTYSEQTKLKRIFAFLLWNADSNYHLIGSSYMSKTDCMCWLQIVMPLRPLLLQVRPLQETESLGWFRHFRAQGTNITWWTKKWQILLSAYTILINDMIERISSLKNSFSHRPNLKTIMVSVYRILEYYETIFGHAGCWNLWKSRA